MTQADETDTRTRLLVAAADLIAATPGEDFSLRAVCDAVGVKMPTLYHFFGSKQGLIDAVIERGFDMYLGEKIAMEHSGDPIGDIRAGWDAHVAFGLANPGFYTLMYGTVRPGYIPQAQARATAILLSLTEAAAAQGRLVVPAAQASDHVLVANVGVTLKQIAAGKSDPNLSAIMRETTLNAITGAAPAQTSDALGAVIELAAAHPQTLGEAETRLLVDWLGRFRGES